MRFTAMIVSMTSFLLLFGCASYTPEPLTVNHPAHPQAAVAAMRPASQTLRLYRLGFACRALRRSKAATMRTMVSDASAEKTAVGEGKVIAVVPSSGQLVIEHGPIKDFMDAMTMGYPTEPASLLEGLKAGDKVRFAIDVKRKVIVKVEKIN